jgi:hypothetical protein
LSQKEKGFLGMAETFLLLAWAIFFWACVAVACIFMYRKTQKVSHNVTSAPIVSDMPHHEESDDMMSMPQLQHEQSRLLSYRRKLRLQQKALQHDIQKEKAPGNIAISLMLGTARIKMNKIFVYRNRLNISLLETQHVDAELKRNNTHINQLKEKALQQDRRKRETKIANKDAFPCNNKDSDRKKQEEMFILQLKQELAHYSPIHFGYGLRPHENVNKHFTLWEHNIQEHSIQQKVENTHSGNTDQGVLTPTLADEHTFPFSGEYFIEEIQTYNPILSLKSAEHYDDPHVQWEAVKDDHPHP